MRTSKKAKMPAHVHTADCVHDEDDYSSDGGESVVQRFWGASVKPGQEFRLSLTRTGACLPRRTRAPRGRGAGCALMPPCALSPSLWHRACSPLSPARRLARDAGGDHVRVRGPQRVDVRD